MQVGKDLISLITSRANIDELLKLDDAIDLVIPRGSNALVSHIQQNTKIAVLGHADGICHIYVDPDCDIDMACKICVDSKIDYPAACNAVEKILVHEDLAQDGRVRHAVLCCAVLCCAVLCCAVLCRAVPCCAVLCRAVPCRAVLGRAVPCLAQQFHLT